MDQVERIANAVLYEGYVLWPYRRSAIKNRQRWTFGGVYPRAYAETSQGTDPWQMQTECLVVGRDPVVSVQLRWLQVVERQVAQRTADGTLVPVDALQVDEEHYLTWDEAREQTYRLDGLHVPALATPHTVPVTSPAGIAEEPLTTKAGESVGALIRRWQQLSGQLTVRAEALEPELFRLTVTLTNTGPWDGRNRESALPGTFVSTHTILRVHAGALVSLLDPPAELATAAAGCRNLATWPVLVGPEGERKTLLSSPIILYDYPQIAPESPGDLYDGTEIDQLLILNVLAMTDEEKAEMRASDPRARAILERSEALTADDFARLHGAIREFRMLREEADIGPHFAELERPAPDHVLIAGILVRPGSRVRLCPQPGADAFDVVLAGKVAIVEQIEQDYEERIHLAVTIEDDPGRDLGSSGRVPGHRFYFGIDEVEPLDNPSAREEGR